MFTWCGEENLFSYVSLLPSGKTGNLFFLCCLQIQICGPHLPFLLLQTVLSVSSSSFCFSALSSWTQLWCYWRTLWERRSHQHMKVSWFSYDCCSCCLEGSREMAVAHKLWKPLSMSLLHLSLVSWMWF